MISLAEHFTSIQGEGVWIGQTMHFLRLAGCSVGGIDAVCTTYDGRTFACDTDYKPTLKFDDPEKILELIPANIRHVCLTGGEPFDRDLSPLLSILFGNNKKVHIETSGTKHIPPDIGKFRPWITVSPKAPFQLGNLYRAHEIKFLVDEKFDGSDALFRSALTLEEPVIWLQPINHKDSLNEENIAQCLSLARTHPRCRVSIQLHKVLHVK
jgi:organic radical activating enzyme